MKKETMSKEKVEEILKKNKEFLPPAVTGMQLYKGLLLVGGQGMSLFDAEGKEYIDFWAGVATAQLGYSHPKLTDAVVEQVKKLHYTSCHYATELQVRLAEKMAEIAPGKLKKSYFVNSGTEANEVAIRTMRLATGRLQVFGMERSYHGKSMVTGSMTGMASWMQNVPNAADIYRIPTSYCYRCPFGQEYPDCGVQCARYLEEAIKTNTPGRGAGLLIEPIHGAGGLIDRPVPEYFKIVREILDKYNMLLVVDEVQTGMGRTGKWWGIEQSGVEPDGLTTAKGLGGGYAVGGFTAKEEIADVLTPYSFYSTFGGNPVACAAVLATIEAIEEEKLMQNAEKLGSYFKKELEKLKEDHKIIGDVRGMGLMLGVEIVKDKESKEFAKDEARKILEIAKNNGVLLGVGGLEGNVIRLQPPLIVKKEHVDKCLEVMDKACAEVEKGP